MLRTCLVSSHVAPWRDKCQCVERMCVRVWRKRDRETAVTVFLLTTYLHSIDPAKRGLNVNADQREWTRDIRRPVAGKNNKKAKQKSSRYCVSPDLLRAGIISEIASPNRSSLVRPSAREPRLALSRRYSGTTRRSRVGPKQTKTNQSGRRLRVLRAIGGSYPDVHLVSILIRKDLE